MEYKVKSLAKALEVLECFTVKSPENGISEIARQCGLPKSSVHNILSTFQQMGYVNQNEETSRYSLSLKMLQFSRVVVAHIGLEEALMPYMRRIAAELKEIVYLGIPRGTEVVYISSFADGVHAESRSILGEQAPLYCTGIGKAMLAYLPNPSAHLPETLAPFTAETITDAGALSMELERVRRQGYAVDNMEHEFGIKCLAVPVFGSKGEVECGVSISGPSLRFGDDRLESMARTMHDILAPIQRKL